VPAPKATAAPAPLEQKLAPSPAPAAQKPAAPSPRRPADEVAIFTFKAGPEVSEQTAALVTQAFGAALHERGIPTLSQEDVKAALSFEKERQMLGCDTEGCFAEIGGALGVRKMVSGSLGRLGDSLVLNAQLVDARRATVERRHTVRRPLSRGDDAFLEAVPELVEALFPRGPEAGMERRLAIAAGGWLELHGDPGGAGRLLARWAFRPWLRAAAGFLVAPDRIGATARLDWLPWKPEQRLHPVASLELLALSADPLSPGVGLSVGAEWRVTPRFDLALELPVVRLFATLDGMRETYFFAALTAAWRL
jgi:TolB-like protein